MQKEPPLLDPKTMSATDLNTKLRTRSYVEGGVAPTQADTEAFKSLFGSNPQVIQWVSQMASYYAVERQELASLKPADKKSDKPAPAEKKQDAKKKKDDKKPDKKQEGKTPEPTTTTTTSTASEKKIRAVKKEGGKKGQDLAGMSDLGSKFGLANLVEPEGDMELLTLAFEAMNAEVDPEGEERRGGAGGVGKILVSATDAKFACIVHVPEVFTTPEHPENPHNYNVSAIEWFEASFATLPGDQQGHVVLEKSKNLVKAIYNPDPEKGRYTLKAKDAVIGSSFAFLRSKNLVVDDDSDDEIVFGDDDMPGF